MPVGMDVRVNPAGQNGQPGEIVGDSALRRGSADARNPSAFYNDDRTVVNFPLAIEDGRGFQNDGALLSDGEFSCQKQRNEPGKNDRKSQA